MTRNTPSRRDFIGVAMAAASWSLGFTRVRAAAERPAVALTPPRLDHHLLAEADRLIARCVRDEDIAAAALLVRRGEFEFARAYGRAKIETPFLVASLTKPMTAAATMWLRDRGQLSLADPVRNYLPRFAGGERERITIKHLLTHTSGLPDMLPENEELRQRHAPLGEFVERTCRTSLRFSPGTKVAYQSMGYLLLGAIIEAITEQPLPAFMAKAVFAPLKMNQSSLGLGGRNLADTAQCEVAPPNDWDWNSRYWRNLAAPWGGAHSTVHDLANFLEHVTASGSSPWEEATKKEMRSVQTAGLNEAWGLGWSREPKKFAAACSAATFGHSGSTGVIGWRDPDRDLTCVLLTTKPAAESARVLLAPVCDLVARSASPNG